MLLVQSLIPKLIIHFIKIPFINKRMDFIVLPSFLAIIQYNHSYQIISRIVKYQQFVIINQ